MTFLLGLAQGFLVRKILFSLMMTGLKVAVKSTDTKVDDKLLEAVQRGVNGEDYMEIFKGSLKEGQ